MLKWLIIPFALVLTGCVGVPKEDPQTSEVLKQQQAIVDQQNAQIKELTENVNKLIEEKNKATEEAAKPDPPTVVPTQVAPVAKKIEPFPTLEACDIASSEKEGAISLSKLKDCSQKRIDYENRKTEWYAKYGQAVQIENK